MTTCRPTGRSRGWGRLVRQGLVYFAAIPALPMLVLLMTGRLVFFAVIGVIGSLRAWLQPPSDVSVSAPTLPFWLAWLAALATLACAIGVTFILLGATENWPAPKIWLARGSCLILGLLALLGAYRLALAGTRSLQIALARNLALLIAFELERLRAAADQRVRHVAGNPTQSPGPVEPLRVPEFLADRAEVRSLLGEPTEQALTALLHSLEEFNRAIVCRPPTEPGPVGDIRRQAGLLGDRLTGALRMLDPYLRGPA